MIIQCEQCRTKFKLDDAKVKDKGVKVRCAKCRNVFTVTRDQQSATQPDFAAVLEQHGDMPQAVAPVSFELEQGDETVRQDAAPVSFELEQGSDAFPASTAPVSFEFEQAGAASQDDTPVSFELEQNQDAFPASTTPVSFELEQSGDAPQDSAPVSFELEQDQQPAGPESQEFEFDDSSIPADNHLPQMLVAPLNCRRRMWHRRPRRTILTFRHWHGVMISSQKTAGLATKRSIFQTHSARNRRPHRTRPWLPLRCLQVSRI